MKKLSILLIVLLVAAAFVSAQEVAPSVTVTGSATATFGIDLDTQTTGFENTATATIELKLVPKGTVTKGTVGTISLADFAVTLKNATDVADRVVVTAPSVTAILKFDPVWVKLYSAPSLAAGNAAGFTWHADKDPANQVKPALANKNVATAAGEDETDGYKIVTVDTGEAAPEGGLLLNTDDGLDIYAVPVIVTGDAAGMTKYHGLTFTVKLDPITVDLMVASDGTWANSDNDYAVGAKVTAVVNRVTANAGVFVGPFDAIDVGITVGMGTSVGPTTVALGFDAMLKENDDFDWDASAKVSLNLGLVSLASHTYLWSLAGADIELNQQVVLDASGAVPGLGFTNTTQLINLQSDMEWYNKTAVSYTVDGIKPFAEFSVDSNELMKLTVGAEFSALVENTLFTVKYATADLGEENGLITVAAKVTY